MDTTQFLSRKSKSSLLGLGFLLVLLFGFIDYVTSPYISILIFYLIPIVLVSWFVGRWSGIGISFTCVIAWLVADVHTSLAYPSPALAYWNALVRLALFLFVTGVLTGFRRLALTLELEKNYARTDALTGVHNRRAFKETALRELNRAQRYSHPLTVVFMDLDNFKQINDCLGHCTGDLVLIRVSETAIKILRKTDFIARLEGDEFVILLPETDQCATREVMQRLESELRAQMQEQGWPVTLSMGVVTFMTPPATLNEMVIRADRAMYTVKQGGKNGIAYEVVGDASVGVTAATAKL